jgi:hypothetical protein
MVRNNECIIMVKSGLGWQGMGANKCGVVGRSEECTEMINSGLVW